MTGKWTVEWFGAKMGDRLSRPLCYVKLCIATRGICLKQMGGNFWVERSML